MVLILTPNILEIPIHGVSEDCLRYINYFFFLPNSCIKSLPLGLHNYIWSRVLTKVVEDTASFDDSINCGDFELDGCGQDPPLTNHDPKGTFHDSSCPAQTIIKNSLSGIQSSMWVWAQQVCHQRKNLI